MTQRERAGERERERTAGPSGVGGGGQHGKTIVIKLGTSSIISPTPPYLPHLPLLSSLCFAIHTLRSHPHNHRVILVSSGAIGVGMRRMQSIVPFAQAYAQAGSSTAGPSDNSTSHHTSNSIPTATHAHAHPQAGFTEKDKQKGGLQRKQALAAIGQGRLIAMWDQMFGMLDIGIGQVLLTRADISDRTRYLNAQNTLFELLNLGVVPIVNENDTVSVSEIKFGDNDTLSAITANMVNADYLFLMTDVDCLYTDNPTKNPDARPVKVVRDIQKTREEVSVSTLGSSLGTGGMSTKLIAAELATAAGVTTVILHTSNVSSLIPIIEADEATVHEDQLPICTRFLRKETRLTDRKWWITHGLKEAGNVTIDEGAYRAIQRKESGGRLLPAGVIAVHGTFASHQAVKLVVRRRRRRDESDERQGSTASGSSTPAVATSRMDSMAASPRIRSESPNQPTTPNINPAMSLTSSIASLEQLSMSRAGGGGVANALDSPASAVFAGMSERFGARASTGEKWNHTVGEDAESEWQDFVVGKGLALYNSLEIDRIKGHKSRDIETILGYSETAHVVDSIAFTEMQILAR